MPDKTRNRLVEEPLDDGLPLPTDDDIANHLKIGREIFPPEPKPTTEIEQPSTEGGENKG